MIKCDLADYFGKILSVRGLLISKNLVRIEKNEIKLDYSQPEIFVSRY